MPPKTPSIDWSTVEFVAAKTPVKVAIEAKRTKLARSEQKRTGPRLVLVKGQPPREDRRGRSKLARILAGAALRAKSLGIRHSHSDMRSYVEPGLETFGYGLDLAAAMMVDDEARWIGRIASVIGRASQAREAAKLRGLGERFYWVAE